jgi:hypothetical protein
MTKTEGGAHVTVYLPPNINALLDDSVRKSGRTKRVEVQMRIEDHLKRYQSLTEIGHRTAR